MTTQLYQVDAFTDQPFHGNPAAVCLLRGPRDEEWMQQVASEMNLSKTAFLERRENGFGLRWFTPTAEVDLCGLATLASAHILWETGETRPDAELRFHTRSGMLSARRVDDLIELNVGHVVHSCKVSVKETKTEILVLDVERLAHSFGHLVDKAERTLAPATAKIHRLEP